MYIKHLIRSVPLKLLALERIEKLICRILQLLLVDRGVALGMIEVYNRVLEIKIWHSIVAQVITEELGLNMEKVDLDVLGSCKKVMFLYKWLSRFMGV